MAFKKKVQNKARKGLNPKMRPYGAHAETRQEQILAARRRKRKS